MSFSARDKTKQAHQTLERQRAPLFLASHVNNANAVSLVCGSVGVNGNDFLLAISRSFGEMGWRGLGERDERDGLLYVPNSHIRRSYLIRTMQLVGF